MEQKTAIAHEVKGVLDSWVRYEGQVKQRQQKELAETIIAKIDKELEDPKVLKRILDQSVADVERKCSPAGCIGTATDIKQVSFRSRSRSFDSMVGHSTTVHISSIDISKSTVRHTIFWLCCLMTLLRQTFLP